MNKKTLIPLATLIILLVLLLAGQRFGATWAGGGGYKTAHFATVLANVNDFTANKSAGDAKIARGATVQTPQGSRLALALNNHVILTMDERTDVRLERLDDNLVEVTLLRGRIVVTNTNSIVTVRVRTNYTINEFANGWVSFVNYDFKETVDIFPDITNVATHLKLTNLNVNSSGPVSIHETKPVSYQVIDFQPLVGAGADFYEWAAGVVIDQKSK